MHIGPKNLALENRLPSQTASDGSQQTAKDPLTMVDEIDTQPRSKAELIPARLTAPASPRFLRVRSGSGSPEAVNLNLPDQQGQPGRGWTTAQKPNMPDFQGQPGSGWLPYPLLTEPSYQGQAGQGWDG